ESVPPGLANFGIGTLASTRASAVGSGHSCLGAHSCPMHDARPIRVALPCPCAGGSEAGVPRSGGSAVRLCRQHLEHVAVRVSEIKTASATTVIDLHVVEGAGSAAISNALGADAIEDAVKLRLIDLERVVMTLELRVIVKIEGQLLVAPHGREVRGRTYIPHAEDVAAEVVGWFLVMRGDVIMVEVIGHRLPIGVVPVIESWIGASVQVVRAGRARVLPSSRIAD